MLAEARKGRGHRVKGLGLNAGGDWEPPKHFQRRKADQVWSRRVRVSARKGQGMEEQ